MPHSIQVIGVVFIISSAGEDSDHDRILKHLGSKLVNSALKFDQRFKFDQR